MHQLPVDSHWYCRLDIYSFGRLSTVIVRERETTGSPSYSRLVEYRTRTRSCPPNEKWFAWWGGSARPRKIGACHTAWTFREREKKTTMDSLLPPAGPYTLTDQYLYSSSVLLSCVLQRPPLSNWCLVQY